MKKAEMNIQTEQLIYFILIAIVLLLIVILVIGLRGNTEDIGGVIERLVGSLF